MCAFAAKAAASAFTEPQCRVNNTTQYIFHTQDSCTYELRMSTFAAKDAACTSQCALQRVAACCSALQRVAACCSVLQRVAACCSVLQRVTACCSVLQRVAACCSVLQ